MTLPARLLATVMVAALGLPPIAAASHTGHSGSVLSDAIVVARSRQGQVELATVTDVFRVAVSPAHERCATSSSDRSRAALVPPPPGRPAALGDIAGDRELLVRFDVPAGRAPPA